MWRETSRLDGLDQSMTKIAPVLFALIPLAAVVSAYVMTA